MGLAHKTSMCGGLPDTLQISCFSAMYPDPFWLDPHTCEEVLESSLYTGSSAIMSAVQSD